MHPTLLSTYTAILEGNQTEARASVQAALEAGLAPEIVLNEGMIAAMSEVGRRFEEGEYYVPEMLISARAMQASMSLLKPHLRQQGIPSAGKIVIGTVQGDLHDIGKNLVSMMLEGAGFEIIDLGSDVSPGQFVDGVREHDAQVVALSALLTTTMMNIQATITTLQEAGVRDHVKVIIGGAPVTEDYARKVGADGFAIDASRAVAVVKNLVGAG